MPNSEQTDDVTEAPAGNAADRQAEAPPVLAEGLGAQPAHVQRDGQQAATPTALRPDGRPVGRPWQAGQSGNPHGRKPALQDIARRYTGVNGEKALRALANIAYDEQQPVKDRIVAIKELLDRAHGQAPATVAATFTGLVFGGRYRQTGELHASAAIPSPMARDVDGEHRVRELRPIIDESRPLPGQRPAQSSTAPLPDVAPTPPPRRVARFLSSDGGLTSVVQPEAPAVAAEAPALSAHVDRLL